MNIKDAKKLANVVCQGRLDLIEYLRNVKIERLDRAAEEVKLHNFRFKLNNFPGDITPAKLVKITEQLAKR